MKKLKSILSITLILSAFAIGYQPSAIGQTNAPIFDAPTSSVISFLTGQSTNWYAATYGIISTEKHQSGAGIAAFYKASDFVGAFMRLDAIGNTLYMPSGNFQLQFPIKFMGAFEAVPFAFTGVAIPLGRGNADVSLAGVFGAGFSFTLPRSSRWYVPHSFLLDFEHWTNIPGNQYRFGLSWKLGK